MGMVWDLKSVPYQLRGGNSPKQIPYQSIPAPQAMEKLWTTMGKTTCTHSKPIPQLLTGGMQLLVKNISTKVKIIQENDHFVIKLLSPFIQIQLRLSLSHILPIAGHFTKLSTISIPYDAGFSLTFEVQGHWLVSRQVPCKTEGRRPEPLGERTRTQVSQECIFLQCGKEIFVL